jgi:NAD(P)-dependent dehydrogenase (short-subunit alcohol dehydrogenase family)
VLVNNAGGDVQREFHNLTEDEIQALLELNLTSAVFLTRLVLPGMLVRGRGHVVNVSSMAGRVSFPYTEAYAAAKDGLIGFTRVPRADYRDRGVSGSTGKLTVGAIRADKGEVAVLPGPGKLLRGLMDRFPALAPAMNRATGATGTMRTVAEYRERQARLAVVGGRARAELTAKSASRHRRRIGEGPLAPGRVAAGGQARQPRRRPRARSALS